MTDGGDEASVFDLLGVSKGQLIEELPGAALDAMVERAWDPETPEAADVLVPTMGDEPVGFGEQAALAGGGDGPGGAIEFADT